MRAIVPLLLLFLLLLAPIAHAEDNTDQSIIDQIKDALKALYEFITGLPSDIWDRIKSFMSSLADTLAAVKNALVMIADAVKSAFDTLYTIVTYPFVLLKQAIMGLVEAINEVKNALGMAGTSIVDAVKSAAAWLKDNVHVLLLAAAGIIAIRYALAG